MTDDIEERAVLARRGIMDHSDCEDCVEDWTFLMRQGRREFPLGLRAVLACLAFAEREGQRFLNIGFKIPVIQLL